ncbi:hypothetical protein [Enterococcus faecalis]|uniref:hypothetical protein n=1 Tax=Enterococcus faecalis TaxID=1351 RepID=UPI0032C0A911
MSKDEGLIKGTLDTVLKYAYPDNYKNYLSYLYAFALKSWQANMRIIKGKSD